MAATLTKALDLDPIDVTHAKVAKLSSDDMVGMVPVNSAANDNVEMDAVASEIEEEVNGGDGSMAKIRDAAACAVSNIENDDEINGAVNVEVHNYTDCDKENLVGDNVGCIALSQTVCKKEKNVGHSITLSKCEHFTIKFGNCSK